MWACRLAAKATVKVKYKLTRRNPPRGRGLLGVASATRVISDPVLDSSSTTGATTGLAESASGVRVAGSGGRGGGGGAGGGEKGSRVHQVAWLGNACAVSADGKYVISCGHWDDSFKVREGTRPPIHPSITPASAQPPARPHTHTQARSRDSSVTRAAAARTHTAHATHPRAARFQITEVDTGVVVRSVAVHQDVVTCVALDRHALATGSLDATVRVWSYARGGVAIPCQHVLHGHDDAVTCVAVSMHHDLVVSGR